MPDASDVVLFEGRLWVVAGDPPVLRQLTLDLRETGRAEPLDRHYLRITHLASWPTWMALEGEAYARKLREAGVDVSATRYEGIIHDFVMLDAPDTGVLEVGSYVIDREGDQPRSIGVVVTAPEYLDGARGHRDERGSLSPRTP